MHLLDTYVHRVENNSKEKATFTRISRLKIRVYSYYVNLPLPLGLYRPIHVDIPVKIRVYLQHFVSKCLNLKLPPFHVQMSKFKTVLTGVSFENSYYLK